MSWWRRLLGLDPPGSARAADVQEEASAEEGFLEALELPIDGVLDLHTFRPADVKALVTDYVAECRARGITELRIIHGKGKGVLRRTVHAALEQIPEVERFELAGAEAGGWGATLVTLRAPGRGAYSATRLE
jgi:DNA-nicking Smr family endonuclease